MEEPIGKAPYYPAARSIRGTSRERLDDQRRGENQTGTREALAAVYDLLRVVARRHATVGAVRVDEPESTSLVRAADGRSDHGPGSRLARSRG